MTPNDHAIWVNIGQVRGNDSNDREIAQQVGTGESVRAEVTFTGPPWVFLMYTSLTSVHMRERPEINEQIYQGNSTLY